MDKIFFDNWQDIVRTLICGSLGYFGLVLLLRISGKRTLAKMNAFDLVVTVAFGSTLATLLLNKTVALAEGLVALGLLILLQYVVAKLSVWSDAFQGLIKSEPSLLFHKGQFLRKTLRGERVTEEEVRAAVRAAGISGLDPVDAVVLETDGTFSVITRGDTSQLTVKVPPGVGSV